MFFILCLSYAFYGLKSYHSFYKNLQWSHLRDFSYSPLLIFQVEESLDDKATTEIAQLSSWNIFINLNSKYVSICLCKNMK